MEELEVGSSELKKKKKKKKRTVLQLAGVVRLPTEITCWKLFVVNLSVAYCLLTSYNSSPDIVVSCRVGKGCINRFSADCCDSCVKLE